MQTEPKVGPRRTIRCSSMQVQKGLAFSLAIAFALQKDCVGDWRPKGFQRVPLENLLLVSGRKPTNHGCSDHSAP